jgi:glutathione S-transferase
MAWRPALPAPPVKNTRMTFLSSSIAARQYGAFAATGKARRARLPCGGITKEKHMAITIYGVYRSRASRNYWLANEIGLEIESVPVIQAYRLADPLAPDAPLNTRSPAFLALSPAGAIPVLKDGDLVLTESLAINLHLARRHGGALGPRDADEDALMQAAALHAATAIEPHSVSILYAFAEGRADTPEGAAEVAACAEKLARPLAMLEAHFAAHDHLIGNRFTVADINLAEILRYAQAHPDLLPAHPAVDRWLKAAQARPAFRAMWERRLAEPA